MFFEHLINALTYLLMRQYCYYMYIIPTAALFIYSACHLLGFNIKGGNKYVN